MMRTEESHVPKVPVAVVLSTMLTTSCTTMRNVSLVENPNAATRPERIEVQTAGRTYAVYSPTVRGDSVHGWNDVNQTKPISFAVSEIQRARARALSTERTVAAVVAGLVGAYVLFWASVAVLLASDGGF